RQDVRRPLRVREHRGLPPGRTDGDVDPEGTEAGRTMPEARLDVVGDVVGEADEVPDPAIREPQLGVALEPVGGVAVVHPGSFARVASGRWHEGSPPPRSSTATTCSSSCGPGTGSC